MCGQNVYVYTTSASALINGMCERGNTYKQRNDPCQEPIHRVCRSRLAKYYLLLVRGQCSYEMAPSASNEMLCMRDSCQ